MFKIVGYTDNALRGVQAASFQAAHLMLAVFSPAFEGSFSLRVTIAFYTSILLEIPAGIFADKYGHIKSVVLGLLMNSISFSLLYVSIINVNYAYITLICSSFLGAAGMCFISGSYQAMLQNYVDKKASIENRSNAIIQSYQFGRFLSSISPSVLIIAFLMLWKLDSLYQEYLVLCSLLFFLLSIYVLKNFGWFIEEKNTCSKRESMSFETIRNLNLKQVKYAIMVIFGQFMMVFFSTYFVVSVLNSVSLDRLDNFSFSIFIFIIISGNMSNYLKCTIVPKLSSRNTSENIIIIAFFISLGSSAILYLIPDEYKYYSCIIYMVMFRLSVSMLTDTATNYFMSILPSQSRATLFSALTNFVSFVVASISALIGYLSIGILSVNQILLILASVSFLGFIVFTFLSVLNKKWANDYGY
ncbi:MFS transporter [Vibrio cholerae]|nr:MFS transporter [Vibrio cholerae]EJY4340674.1 MFS transporter [Vibrio cholerae]